VEKERLAVLQAEIKAQIQEIEEIYIRIEDRKRKTDKAALESVGYQLHNLYCAFEDLFKIVAETFENHIQDKSKYNQELLKRMAIPIEGVRPRLLSQECLHLLDNLRSFRHLFRHAYSYELDERKLKIVLEDAFTVRSIYPSDVKVFLNSFEPPICG
jgi:uncharacterized protein YutE (UPF0331/DUF86 family)